MLVFFCPEPPRWLVSHGDYAKTRSVMAISHANGDMDDDLVRLELSKISESSESEGQPPYWLAPSVQHAGEPKTPSLDDNY